MIESFLRWLLVACLSALFGCVVAAVPTLLLSALIGPHALVAFYFGFVATHAAGEARPRIAAYVFKEVK